ncbi:MAG: hypothetical protein AAGG09_10700 [Pseudomonadota bacterium]
MSFIRPEARAALLRWRELAVTLAAAAFGVWVATRGGLFYGSLGTLVCLFALGLALAAWRRMRFGAHGTAPGIVRYDEGAVAYFGPETGGIVALSEVREISAVATENGVVWRIEQTAGPRVEIPIGASGAEGLFDTFAALPGARPAAFLQAVEHPPDGIRRIWRRDGSGDEPRLPRP